MYFYCSKFGVERQVVFVEQRQLSIIALIDWCA